MFKIQEQKSNVFISSIFMLIRHKIQEHNWSSKLQKYISETSVLQHLRSFMKDGKIL